MHADLLRRRAVEAVRDDQQLARVAVLAGVVRRSTPHAVARFRFPRVGANSTSPAGAGLATIGVAAFGARRWTAVTSHRSITVRDVGPGRWGREGPRLPCTFPPSNVPSPGLVGSLLVTVRTRGEHGVSPVRAHCHARDDGGGPPTSASPLRLACTRRSAGAPARRTMSPVVPSVAERVGHPGGVSGVSRGLIADDGDAHLGRDVGTGTWSTEGTSR